MASRHIVNTPGSAQLQPPRVRLTRRHLLRGRLQMRNYATVCTLPEADVVLDAPLLLEADWKSCCSVV